ncbi:hypothetical protein [Citreicoccus inhibens]|uniref:hypothetical protein n=1 Tax=Citreicoccus inhibens TaxID=2849499 RepID=UPI001F439A39|nr:hypothetical protein [Citreicoccus inhibens]
MKLLGRDIPARELIARIEERLRTRGLPTSESVAVPVEGVEPPVDPLSFNLHSLEENADATRPLPLHTHRGGVGQLVLVAKWAFRTSCQVFINEAFGRQRVFNGVVRDSYAQLSAEVIRLRREVEALRAQAAEHPPVAPRASQMTAPSHAPESAARPPSSAARTAPTPRASAPESAALATSGHAGPTPPRRPATNEPAKRTEERQVRARGSAKRSRRPKQP